MPQESFFAEHAQFVATLMASMMTIIGVLLTLLGTIVYRHNKEEQHRQNERLDSLEDNVSGLKGGHEVSNRDIEHLGKTLERLLQEMVDYRKENNDEHREIKTDLKTLLRSRATA
jgi:hypothetical protein